MGKTGTTIWAQVKGVKGQIRLVPASEGEVKKPGPNQRYKAQSCITKLSRQQSQDARGGRGGAPTVDVRVRRNMQRSKVSVLGTKQKSR
ncbi:hypothetical protein ABH15_07385 [Methanoculleus taiwanensis]|uniref:DUF5350 family protein n=1 Tax=Methanoculleus taiwanensis TaxID=1550565 RepID=A0A498H111_9EURY|nr:DUF5350 domain-containing protein [Methanoculleus taiwanensis]RXE56015.1 hypothetical protein ABH15_07385 [Methanoculleus taiwanensis]